MLSSLEKLVQLPRLTQQRRKRRTIRNNLQKGCGKPASCRLTIEHLEERRLLTAFYDSFENGLTSHWSIPDLGSESRVGIRDLYAEGVITNAFAQQFGQGGNEKSLAFDSTRASGDNNSDLGIAILNADLTELDDAILTFHHFEAGDENTSLPDQHLTTTAGDGLAVSRDGTNWYLLKHISNGDINRSGDGLWQMFEFDLGSEFDRINTSFSAGLQFNGNIRFKFSQYDDRTLPTDGWAIDELTIAVQANTFTLDRPRGAFHRFNLAGEDDADYYFRAAVYGNPDANTPIMVVVHGSNGDTNFDGDPWRWHKFVSDPANGIESLIVVAPAFVEDVAPGRFNTPVRYPKLSWNTLDDAASDLVLLETVNTISATGFGDGSEIYLWGFSAGGQYVGRFTAAHPDRVAAAVVGGPSSQVLPTEFVSYHHGIGRNDYYPPPSGVSFDLDEWLQSRIMYWVGQDDNDPNHSQLEQNDAIDSTQGISRRERSIYQLEQMHLAAQQQGIDPRDYEFELFVSEGDGHGWGTSDIPGIHEFLFRDRSPASLPIKIHPRIVQVATADNRQQYLPQNVERIRPNEEFFAEFWIEAPQEGSTGIESGTMELFFDTTLADVLSIEHGLFANAATGDLDEAAGRIHNFAGSTTLNGVGVNEFAMFGRIKLKAGGTTLSDPARFAFALQRHDGQDFILDGGQTHRTDFLPFATTLIADSGQGITNASVQGLVFHDTNGDGDRQPTENGIANREVRLTHITTGETIATEFEHEPDDSLGHGAYLFDAHPWVSLSAVGASVMNPGVFAYDKGTDESSTGAHVFAHRISSGSNTLWVENNSSLRMDFLAPTKSISIDMVAKVGDSRDYGTLEVFNSDGVSLESKRSSDLADAAFETVTITRSQADIAYAVATGSGGNNVRLDNLKFTSELRTETNLEGAYLFKHVVPGSYDVVLTPVSTMFTTAPEDNEHAISFNAGDVLTNTDFGSCQQALSLAIDVPSLSESGGSSSTTVTRLCTDNSQPLTVTLSSNDTSEATVPATVTIAANQSFTTFTVTGKDDTLLDGSKVVTVQASASGYVGANDVVTVTDFETLALSIIGTSISEAAGNTTATVTRGNTNISQPLTVSLASSDMSEATVPTTVTIAANQSSATFTVTAVDDTLLDGERVVTVQASASGYVGANDVVTVTDFETLALSIIGTSISEAAGNTTATVTRSNSDISQPLTVSLASNDTSEATVPATVTMAANQSSATFTVTGKDDTLLDGSKVVTVQASASGYVGANDVVTVTDFETLALSIVESSISESGGNTTATVTRGNTDISQPLTVSLASNDTSEATVPATVTMAANQSSATFTVTGKDDTLLDGSKVVTVQASASGYVGANDVVTVTDFETLALSIIGTSISEAAGNTTATVTRGNTDISQPLTVSLASNDTTEATVPATVTIGANQSSATFTVTGKDDTLLDGSKVVTVQASASGYEGDSDVVTVTDFETLTLSIVESSISEAAGSATATVTRSNSDISQPLTVSLDSSDTSEATVPTTVTIAANQSFTTFTVTGKDDTLLDGSKVVTVQASASGYVDDNDVVTVTDFETLTLSIVESSISEAAGNTTATVTRSSTDISQPLTVSLASSDTSEATVPATVTIGANQSSATFTVTGKDDTLLDGSKVVTVQASASGYEGDSDVVTVTDFETLTLSIVESSISEAAGSATATVTRSNSDISQPLTVSLASNDTSEATVPATVTMAANQSSATFTVTGKDDTLLDGSKVVTVQASASGYVGANDVVTVTDFETLALSIVESSISESGGNTTATVTRSNTNISQPLTVSLASSDMSEATVPTTVTIAANQSSATFTVTAVDDTLLDGERVVTVQASASGYVGANDVVTVTDFETLALSIIGTSISEAAGNTTATVTRGNTDISQPLTVSLASSDTSEATVPATVTIGANQSSATFTVTGKDDTLLDGSKVVTVQASASGYEGDSDVVTVTDFETLTLSIVESSISEAAGSATATVTRSNSDISQPLTVSLDSSDTSEATVPTTVTIAANQSFTTFTVTGKDDTLLDGSKVVTVQASASGYVDDNDVVTVTDFETLTLSIVESSISEAAGSATATVTRSNSDISQPLTVSLASSDTSEATVPTTVTIGANQSSATFTVTAKDDMLLDGSKVVTVQASASGYVGANDVVTVTDFETLALSIVESSISESGGTTTATVTRSNTDNSQPLTVSLASSDMSEATVPTTVTIAANQSSATFTVTAVDDTLLDGSQLTAVTASANGYTPGTDTVGVNDYETLTVSLEADSIVEKLVTTATVTRSNTDNSQPLTVSLVSDDTSEATVPQNVTIPLDGDLISFQVTTIDDGLTDGKQSVQIIASAVGYTTLPAEFEVVDNPFPWQNVSNKNDVNADDITTPLDVLFVINYLNRNGSLELPVSDTQRKPPPYYDTNGDGYLTPLDALVVINYLNRHVMGEGEQDSFFMEQPDWSVRSKNNRTSMDSLQAVFADNFDYLDNLTNYCRKAVFSNSTFSEFPGPRDCPQPGLIESLEDLLDLFAQP